MEQLPAWGGAGWPCGRLPDLVHLCLQHAWLSPWRIETSRSQIGPPVCLQDVIDANTFAPLLVQLQQRTWLMHWALFVFFNHENGRNAIIDLFMQER